MSQSGPPFNQDEAGQTSSDGLFSNYGLQQDMMQQNYQANQNFQQGSSQQTLLQSPQEQFQADFSQANSNSQFDLHSNQPNTDIYSQSIVPGGSSPSSPGSQSFVMHSGYPSEMDSTMSGVDYQNFAQQSFNQEGSSFGQFDSSSQNPYQSLTDTTSIQGQEGSVGASFLPSLSNSANLIGNSEQFISGNDASISQPSSGFSSFNLGEGQYNQQNIPADSVGHFNQGTYDYQPGPQTLHQENMAGENYAGISPSASSFGSDILGGQQYNQQNLVSGVTGNFDQSSFGDQSVPQTLQEEPFALTSLQNPASAMGHLPTGELHQQNNQKIQYTDSNNFAPNDQSSQSYPSSGVSYDNSEVHNLGISSLDTYPQAAESVAGQPIPLYQENQQTQFIQQGPPSSDIISPTSSSLTHHSPLPSQFTFIRGTIPFMIFDDESHEIDDVDDLKAVFPFTGHGSSKYTSLDLSQVRFQPYDESSSQKLLRIVDGDGSDEDLYIYAGTAPSSAVQGGSAMTYSANVGSEVPVYIEWDDDITDRNLYGNYVQSKASFYSALGNSPIARRVKAEGAIADDNSFVVLLDD